MKFGSHLKDAIIPEWQSYYIDYDLLKKKLRKAEKDQAFTDKDETEFVEMLDSNLEKVYAFHKATMNRIQEEVDNCETAISTQLPSQDSANELAQLQSKINNIADDINRLERFIRFNYTGFLKIVKKHDRHTDYILRPMFMVRLNQCPFWREDNEQLLIKLSSLFNQARGGGRTMSFRPTNFRPQDVPEVGVDSSRTLVKRFFVHTDDVLELKTSVLRHLPALIYKESDKSNDKDDIDPPISSLYLDDSDMDSYSSRVESAPASQIIRLRWYGSVNGNRSISVERRTLEDENRGDLKDRFIIKDKYVEGFITGDQTFLEKTVNKMKQSGTRSDQEIQVYSNLVKEVQKTIVDKHMQPVLRTYYKRTAFQIPGDNTVRMALDTDLCFIREDSGMFDDTERRSEGEWYRHDVNIDFPFSNLPQGEVNCYPYATFEIKLDLAPNEHEPQWVIDLEESGLLEEAYQFSKFVHGMAILFDTRVPLLPYWLAQIDDDNSKLLPILPSQRPSVGKKTHKETNSASREETSDNQPDTEAGPSTSKPNERTSLLGNQKATKSYMGSDTTSQQAKDMEEHNQLSAYKQFAEIAQRFFGRKQTITDNLEPPVILPPGVKIPKKIVTPLKVEPKVFFANERTYFSWMQFGTMLSTFSLALFNSGDAVGKISGIVYTLVALSTLIYGGGLYYRRRELIRARAAGPYEEIVGPTVICFALLLAVGLNAFLKINVNAPTLYYFFQKEGMMI